jgi:hypothetical protein
MVWNYRIVKKLNRGETVYGIHEAYYGSGEEEIPEGCTQELLDSMGVSWTDTPVVVETCDDEDGDHTEHLRKMLSKMLVACDKPVIDGTEEEE